MLALVGDGNMDAKIIVICSSIEVYQHALTRGREYHLSL